MKRAIIVVLDSVGIGELPDAAEYGDSGSNTLVHIKERCPEMDLVNMNALGLSAIDGGAALASAQPGVPKGAYGKLGEKSKGKDTTTGHWEIGGVWIEKALPTYPEGFPDEVIRAFEKKIGRKTLANCVASGTEIIDRLGDEHVRTGFPIVYTSADSVFQVAMHEEIIPLEEQRRICEIAREMLQGEHNVSRVIMRPFLGANGDYYRTANRHDYSLAPLGTTILDVINAAGLTVAGVGKIADIFAGRGITQSVHIDGNMDGVDKTLGYMDTVEHGLIFANLVDFDMIYGHRNNAKGYAEALMDFDRRLPEILARMRMKDLLFITADHGCDPTTESTDHSREYIPLLVYGDGVRHNVNLHVRESFADIGATVLDYLEIQGEIRGESFLSHIINKEETE